MFKRIKRLTICILVLVTCTLNFSFAKSYDMQDITNIKTIKDFEHDVMVDNMDTVIFGSYPQSDTTGKRNDPIEWIVLERDDEKALLLSKYILDCKSYHNNYGENATWETSSLRKWLNSTFYNIAFSKKEKDRIILADIVNNDRKPFINLGFNLLSIAEGGNDTKDNVFCLSIDECNKYFDSENIFIKKHKDAATKGTEYARNVKNDDVFVKYAKDNNLDLDTLIKTMGESSKIKIGLTVLESNDWDNGNSHYWLRSPGLLHFTDEDKITGKTIESFTATTVNIIGNPNSNGVDIKSVHVGVRPAIWVSIK